MIPYFSFVLQPFQIGAEHVLSAPAEKCSSLTCCRSRLHLVRRAWRVFTVALELDFIHVIGL